MEKNQIRNVRDINKYKAFFYTAMTLSLAFFLILCITTNGVAFKCVFFKDRSDSFMDHYNSVVYNIVDPYENKVIYPPLATLTYKACLEIIPEESIAPLVDDPTYKSQSRYIKIDQGFVFQFMMFCVITLFLFLVSADQLKKGGKFEKVCFMLLFTLSSPFLFMAERGNNIIIPMAFSMLFLAFYDSKNKWLKEFALISLAIAVGYKIYPVAFGVLLLRNKQYKELFRTAVYCVGTLILPFFIFYDGFNSLGMMLTNIVGFGDKRSSSGNLESQLDFKRAFYFLYGGSRKVTGISINADLVDTYANLFRYLCTGACLIGTFIVKKRWQIVMLCAAIIYGYPGSCSTYLLLFMMPAIMLLIDEEKENSLLNWIYLGLMTLTQFNIALNLGGWTRYWPSKITSVAVVMIALVTLCELLVRFILWNHNRITAGESFFRGCVQVIVGYFPDQWLTKFRKVRADSAKIVEEVSADA